MKAPITLITISRLFAAGGSSLAETLGNRLGWQVLDRSLIAEIARRVDRPEEDIAAIDEKALRPWLRAAAFASAAFPEMPIPPLHAYLNTSIVATVKEVLFEKVAEGPAIVVGHGSHYLFQDRPGTLHLRLIAPFDQRVRVAMKRLDLEEDAAQKHVRRSDADRTEYLRHVHGIDCTDPLHYDLVINTRNLSIDAAADMITRLVRPSH